MDIETIWALQGYGYFLFTVFLVFVLYGYLHHLYKSERIGARDYEKYANIALHDNIDDSPVESISQQNVNCKKGALKNGVV